MNPAVAYSVHWSGRGLGQMREHLRESGALASIYEGTLPPIGCLGDLGTLGLGTAEGS